MKKTIAITLMLIASLLLFSCTGTEKHVETKNTSVHKAEYHKIDAAEAKEMMNGNVTIVDVRRPDEFAAGHIKGAILVTNETIGRNAPKELPDKDATLLIYCRSGRRSKEAALKLLDLGYQNVYDFGGIIDWPYEVVK